MAASRLVKIILSFMGVFILLSIPGWYDYPGNCYFYVNDVIRVTRNSLLPLICFSLLNYSDLDRKIIFPSCLCLFVYTLLCYSDIVKVMLSFYGITIWEELLTVKRIITIIVTLYAAFATKMKIPMKISVVDKKSS